MDDMELPSFADLGIDGTQLDDENQAIEDFFVEHAAEVLEKISKEKLLEAMSACCGDPEDEPVDEENLPEFLIMDYMLKDFDTPEEYIESLIG